MVQSKMICNLHNKVIVLTGASGGIGNTVSAILLESNAKMLLQYKSNNIKIDETLYKTNDIYNYKADITVYKEVEEMCEFTQKKFGKIDVLINNAGICDDASCELMTDTQWDMVVKTNLYGTFYCCKAFLKLMKKQNYGKIINIASIKGIEGSSYQANYCASKAGIIGLSKSLAKETGKYNVSVNSVCPGFIKTKLNNFSEEKNQIAKEKSALKVGNELNTLKNFIKFMCSDDFEGVSGQNFILDSRIM